MRSLVTFNEPKYVLDTGIKVQLHLWNANIIAFTLVKGKSVPKNIRYISPCSLFCHSG